MENKDEVLTSLSDSLPMWTEGKIIVLIINHIENNSKIIEKRFVYLKQKYYF